MTMYLKDISYENAKVLLPSLTKNDYNNKYIGVYYNSLVNNILVCTTYSKFEKGDLVINYEQFVYLIELSHIIHPSEAYEIVSKQATIVGEI